MFKSTNSAGIGVIIRDCGGNAIGALTMPVALTSSVAELDALACRRTVQFAIEIGPRKVIFEGDSAEVIQAISQGNSDFSVYLTIGTEIMNLKKMTGTYFRSISILFYMISQATELNKYSYRDPIKKKKTLLLNSVGFLSLYYYNKEQNQGSVRI